MGNKDKMELPNLQPGIIQKDTSHGNRKVSIVELW